MALDSEYYQKDAIQAIPGARFRVEKNRWELPLTWVHAKMLRLQFGDQLEVGPKLCAWSHEVLQACVAPLMDLREAEDGPAYAEDLFKHVRASTRYLLAAQRGSLLVPVGGGKTVASSLALDAAGERPRLPALIVTTTSMTETWRRELADWAPGLTVEVATGSAKQRVAAIEAESDVVVTSWHLLGRDSRLAPYGSIALEHCVDCDKKSERKRASCHRCPGPLNMVPWRTVVADELHRAVNPRTNWTRALWAVSAQAEQRWGLTATPLVNHPGDLWAILHFMDPVAWSDRSRYIDFWCQTSWTGWGVEVVGLRPDRADAFRELTMPYWRRVPEEVVRGQRSKPLVQVRELEMKGKQRTQFKAMKKDLLIDGDDGQVVAWNPLVQTTRLWQLSSACLESDGEDGARLVGPSNKIDALKDILDELGDSQAVVFAAHRQLLELAERELPEGSWLSAHGGVQGPARQANIDKFTAGGAPLLLTTFGAGGEGLTLVNASVVVFLQDHWSQIAMTQALGRVDRTGQKQQVLAIYLRSVDSMDDRVISKAAEKGARLEDFVRDRETLARLLKGDA